MKAPARIVLGFARCAGARHTRRARRAGVRSVSPARRSSFGRIWLAVAAGIVLGILYAGACIDTLSKVP